PRPQPPAERPGLVRAVPALALRPGAGAFTCVRAMRCRSSLVRPAVRIGCGPQLVRDLLLRAGRCRLVLLKGGDRRVLRAGHGGVVGLCGASGHGDASWSVVVPGYARERPGSPTVSPFCDDRDTVAGVRGKGGDGTA